MSFKYTIEETQLEGVKVFARRVYRLSWNNVDSLGRLLEHTTTQNFKVYTFSKNVDKDYTEIMKLGNTLLVCKVHFI